MGRFTFLLALGAALLAGSPASDAATARINDATLARSQERIQMPRWDGLAAASRVLDGSAAYSDPIGDGDGNLPPDISNIVVTETATTLTFQIGVANLGPGLVEGDFLSVAVDTDRSTATGCSGTEVALAVLGETAPTPDYARLGRCTGSTYDFNTAQGAFSYSYAPGVGLDGPGTVTLQASIGDVGAAAFDFRVGSSYQGVATTYYDLAGPFTFAPTAPPSPTPPPSTPPPSTPPPSTPPPATVVCVVPNVVGRTLASARIRIFNANCTLGRVSKARSSRKKGTVIAQAPHAGTTRAEGGRVNVIVSRGRR
jgi:hypothetical protein